MVVSVEKFEWLTKINERNVWRLLSQDKREFFTILANEPHESEKINKRVRQIDDSVVPLYDDYDFLLETLNSMKTNDKNKASKPSIGINFETLSNEKFFIKMENTIPLYLVLRMFVVRKIKEDSKILKGIYKFFYVKQKKLVSVVSQKKIIETLGYGKGAERYIRAQTKKLENLGIIKKHKWSLGDYYRLNIYELGCYDTNGEHWLIDDVKF